MLIRGVLLLLNMTGVPRLLFRLMLDRRVPARLKLMLPAALAYLISPIDVIPDILPALGRLDDLLVILLSVALFLLLAPKDVVLEHIRSGRAGAMEDRDRERRPDGKVIEGTYRFKDDEQDTTR